MLSSRWLCFLALAFSAHCSAAFLSPSALQHHSIGTQLHSCSAFQPLSLSAAQDISPSAPQPLSSVTPAARAPQPLLLRPSAPRSAAGFARGRKAILLSASDGLSEVEKAVKAAEEAAKRAERIKKGILNTEDEKEEEDANRDTTDETLEASGVGRRRNNIMFDIKIEKPLGIVLEENHPSVKGVFIAKILDEGNAAACGSNLEGMQLVAVQGEEQLAVTLDEAMSAFAEAESPVTLRLFDGTASTLYGGWNEEAKGKEVEITTGLPNKALIDRMRSGL